MIVELRGLELHGRHGVLAEERERGQRFLFDIRLWPRDDRAAATDEIRDAVDYRDVVTAVVEVSGRRTFNLLEALAAAVADELLVRLPVVRAEVTVRKPEVVLALAVEHAAVIVERYAGPTESA